MSIAAADDKMLRRCVSFMEATSGRGYAKSQVSMRVSSLFNRTPHASAALERNIDEVWAEKLAKNPHLFNGSKFRLASMAISPAKLDMNVGLTDYKTYIGLCTRCELIEQLKRDGEAQKQDHTVHLSNKIGVAAALVTEDDRVCFLKRSSAVGAYPNMYDVPGGHPEPQHVNLTEDALPASPDDEALNQKCVDELFDSIVTEIHEEVNVPESQLTAPLLLGVTLQGQAETPSFAFLVHASLTSADVLELYKNGPQDQYETTKLTFQSIQELSTSTLALTPSASGCVEFLREYQTFKA